MKRKTKFPTKVKANLSPRNFEKIVLRNKSGLKFITEADNILEALLNILPNTTNVEAMAGLFSGLEEKSPCLIPPEIQNASRKFWEYSGLNLSVDPDRPSYMGKFAGIVENSPPINKAIKSKKTDGFTKIALLLANAAKMDAANASPEESKEFFDARIDAKKNVEKIEFSPQRIKIYLIICLAWQEIKKLSSTNEFHDWLLAIKDREGNTFISANTDSREIRKICQSINLEFPNQWRAPDTKNENPGPL